MSSEDERLAWLRAQIEGDKAAAEVIRHGGFMPERWDTDPPGQVNPAAEPASGVISDAIGQELDYSSGWVRIVPWTRENGEPPGADCQDPGCVVALAENGRRQFDHIIRHDPRNAAADCDAKLGLIDLCARVVADDEGHGYWSDGWAGLGVAKFALASMASAYRHRDGYADHWGESVAKATDSS